MWFTDALVALGVFCLVQLISIYRRRRDTQEFYTDAVTYLAASQEVHALLADPCVTEHELRSQLSKYREIDQLIYKHTHDHSLSLCREIEERLERIEQWPTPAA